MALHPVQTDKAPAAIGPYSQAIQAGSLLFVSGQIGLDPATGNLVGDGFEEQTRQVLENLHQVLASGGCRLEDVAAVDVFLTDIGQFSTFNRIYESFFGSHKPARAVVEVRGLPRGALVEVKCIALSRA